MIQNEVEIAANVKQAVPFFMVSNLEASLRYYVDGLGFHMTNQWIDQGKLRWCWLELGGAALMLQEYAKDRVPAEKRGVTERQIVLAWLLARSPQILPIPGSGSAEHVATNVAAASIELDDDEVAAITRGR